LFILQQLAAIIGFCCRVQPSSLLAAQTALQSRTSQGGEGRQVVSASLLDVLSTLRELAFSLHQSAEEGALGREDGVVEDQVRAQQRRDRGLYTQWAAVLAAHLQQPAVYSIV
jgi:hypothetical protein